MFCPKLCGQDIVQMATFPISIVVVKVNCLADLKDSPIYAGKF